MAGVNTRRVWIGGVTGGIVWLVWAIIVNFAFLMPLYEAAMSNGTMLTEQEMRYSFFMIVWMVQFPALGVLLAALYAGVRGSWGPGPVTAVKVGLIGGFFAGFPVDFYLATWATFPRTIAAGWLLELLVGAVLSTLVAGWLYKDG